MHIFVEYLVVQKWEFAEFHSCSVDMELIMYNSLDFILKQLFTALVERVEME